MGTAIAEDSNQPETTLRAGEILDGKYRVDYLVGQGGMAAVWAGTNERTGKRVALKVLLPAVSATPGADELFEREGLAASRVNHPNVVTVFDVIQHHGAACIVMELLTGEPLEVYLSRVGKLGVNEAYGLLLPAMRGVSAAHAQGVIHRDLKPQNIFICVGPDGRAVTTKVLDFGISLIRSMDAVAGAPLPMGTPAYMAPEQIGGEPIDERADVYGFGVLFYEALSGEVPFSGPPGTDLYRKILYDAPPALGSLRPDLPAGVLRAVDTALAKNPELRHANLDVMIGALEDEILPATPLPGVPVPVTMSALPMVESGRVVVTTPARGVVATPPRGVVITPAQGVRGEQSQEPQATQFLVRFPLETGVRRPSASLTEDEGTQLLLRGVHGGLRALFASRVWQSVAGVAVAGLAAGIGYVGWSSSHKTSVNANLPTAVVQSAPVVEPAPVAAPVVAAEPKPADEAASQPQSAPTVAEQAAAPAPAALPDSVEAPVAVPSASEPVAPLAVVKAAATKQVLPDRSVKLPRARRSTAKLPEVAIQDHDLRAQPAPLSSRPEALPGLSLAPPPARLNPPPTARPPAPGKSQKPRAGGLSTDDF